MIKILSFYYHVYGYGALLQAYALNKFISSTQSYCEQISFNRKVHRIPFVKKISNISVTKIVGKVITLFNVPPFKVIHDRLKIRKYIFAKFMVSIPHSNIYQDCSLSTLLHKNDIFIAGSDQIWNPAWTEDAYFLDFVQDHNGKIAYAASIGTNVLPQSFLDHVIPLLKRFDFISVREESAKKILQPYLNQDVKVVLDPTLLLTREEWNKIAVLPYVPQPYIFVYLLGEKREHRCLIKKYARTLGLKIVFLPHVHFRFNPADCFFADYNLYDVGPREFVGLIKNAEMVITDSFHGCVFSIIYQKKFWALKRHKDSEKENMNSRLYTLFDSLGLRDRLIEDESAEYDAKSLSRQIDYSQVEAKLDALRKDSSDFLLNAIRTVQKRMAEEEGE